MESWLIELEGPKWAGFVDGKSEWTINPNRALRFARKEDADNFKAFWCETAKSTEHTQLLVPEIEGTVSCSSLLREDGRSRRADCPCSRGEAGNGGEKTLAP